VGPKACSGRFASAGIQTPECPARSLAVTPTVLSTKLYSQFQITWQNCDGQGNGAGWSRAEKFVFHINVPYSSVSQPLRDRGPVNSFFITRRPGPNRFTRKYLSKFF
jgi:hypothetical protein